MTSKLEKFFKSYTKEDLFYIMVALYASTIIFNEFSKFFLWGFGAIFLIFYSKTCIYRSKVIWAFIIPVVLHVLFFWNNESFIQSIKQLEKFTVFLVFPLIFIFQQRPINIRKILTYYSSIFSTILFLFFIYYLYINFIDFKGYVLGKDVWKMGYAFSNFLGTHAPRFNMHVSFLSFVNLYLVMNTALGKNKDSSLFVRVVCLGSSLFVMLIINTRVAIAIFAVCAISYIGYIFFVKGFTVKKMFFISAILGIISTVFLFTFPYTLEKFQKKTFNKMDMIGKLDQIDQPEEKIYNSLVTRLTIWSVVLDMSTKKPIKGYGYTNCYALLFQKYKDSNQQFLLKHKFKVHNQFLDYLLKFGYAGVLLLIIFFANKFYIAIKIRSTVFLYFCILFLAANLFDDLLRIYDGIAFSAFWTSVFIKSYLEKRSK
jgi:O-antigen ligase